MIVTCSLCAMILLAPFIQWYQVVFSRVHATLQPALSVSRLVSRFVGHTLLFFMILFL